MMLSTHPARRRSPRSPLAGAHAQRPGRRPRAPRRPRPPPPRPPPARSSIRKAYFDFLLKERLAQGQPDTPELRNAIREELNTRELLVREAKKKGLDKNADIKNQMDLAAQTVLVRAYVADWVKANPIPDADAAQGVRHRSSPRSATRNTRSATSWSRRKTRPRRSSSRCRRASKFEKLAEQLEGSGLEGQRRRPRLERAGQLRQAVLRRDGQATPKGKFTRAAGADAVRLARDPASTTSARPRCRAFEEVKPQLQQRMQAQHLDQYFKELRAKSGV